MSKIFLYAIVLAILILLTMLLPNARAGVTIYLNAETGNGIVFNSTSNDNATFISWPSRDKVVMYGDDGIVYQMSYSDFMKDYRDILLVIKNPIGIIIGKPRKSTNEAPKIAY